MERVANKLVILAVQSKSNEDINLFGRSAFNRYYYATYLEVRKFLGSLEENYLTLPHNDIPKVLKGNVSRIIKREEKKQREKGLQVKASVSLGLESIKKLAEILQEAYKIRVESDYKPEKTVVKKNSSPEVWLGEVSTGKAKNWRSDAVRFCRHISKAYEVLGLL